MDLKRILASAGFTRGNSHRNGLVLVDYQSHVPHSLEHKVADPIHMDLRAIYFALDVRVPGCLGNKGVKSVGRLTEALHIAHTSRGFLDADLDL